MAFLFDSFFFVPIVSKKKRQTVSLINDLYMLLHTSPRGEVYFLLFFIEFHKQERGHCMHWGRNRARAAETPSSQKENRSLTHAANIVALVGFAVCVLFFCAAVGGTSREITYPAESSKAAVSTFLSEHTALADALGMNEFFSAESVSVGSFSDHGEEAYRAFLAENEREWTFSDYLRDAWRTLFGVS